MQIRPDLVLFNGQIITVDEDFNIKEALAIKNGKVTFVGRTSDMRSRLLSASQEIDLKGLTVIPGIIDSHIHMMAIGLEQMKVSLAETQTIFDVLDTIETECKKVGPGGWVVTSQIDFTPGQLKEKRLPNRWELDRVSLKNPVMLTRGAHFSAVNSYALQLSGIDKNSVAPEGGAIVKDPETGEPTGWLADMALQKIRKLIPPISHEDRVTALKASMHGLNKLGVTSIIEPSGDRDDPGLHAYSQLWTEGMLTVRTRMVVGAPFQPPPVDDVGRTLAETSRRRGLGDDGDNMLRIWGIKLLVDGGIETALMREPYEIVPGEQEDPQYRGVLMMPKEQLYEICRQAASIGWRVGIHTVGDAAMDVVLEVFDRVDKEFSIKKKRWSIMHGFLPRPEHFEIMRRLGITVACQHSHNYTKGDVMLKWWGHGRASYSNPVKKYMREGVVVGGGSDGKSCEWRTNILLWIDVTRQTRFAGVLGPELTLTREEMLRYHTNNAAYVMDEEKNLGSIETGKWADLVVLSNDVLRCSSDAIKDIKVFMTIVGGKIVYENNVDSGLASHRPTGHYEHSPEPPSL